jgi:hypothetical protein
MTHERRADLRAVTVDEIDDARRNSGFLAGFD